MKIVSLFSGCGGLDLGFIKAGFDVVWANDVFEDAAKTYARNIGKHRKQIGKNIRHIGTCYDTGDERKNPPPDPRFLARF